MRFAHMNIAVDHTASNHPAGDHLDALTDEAITIIREVATECENPVLLFSGGKDSAVLLHLALLAFAPAIAQARELGIDASGPFAPDTVFMRARHAPPRHPGEFDVVVAMTHDQGLIPVKYLGVEEGVNVTLGLPLVRTSPDHGTAFDIAGTGKASAVSMIEAIKVAAEYVVKGVRLGEPVAKAAE